VVPHRDAEAMIAALEPNERALWATGFYAGLRCGELIGLRRADIDLAAGVIHVRRGWDMVEGEITPKNGKGRTVPIAAVLRDHLDEHLCARARGGEHLFGPPRWVSRSNDRVRARWQERGLPVLHL